MTDRVTLTQEKLAELRQMIAEGYIIKLTAEFLDALESARAELADHKLTLKQIGAAWEGYRRGELGQDEFEGTVAERVEGRR